MSFGRLSETVKSIIYAVQECRFFYTPAVGIIIHMLTDRKFNGTS